jgi:hypothetical protein
MKKVFILLVLAFAGFNPLLKGQISSLGIDSFNYSIPTTVNFNSSYTFSVNVVNYGPSPYNGSLDIGYAIPSPTAVAIYDTSSSHFTNMSLAVGAEQPDTNTITIDGRFKSGINTVVIWPKSTTDVITHDSLKVNIYVTGSFGIANYYEPRPIVFPNPMKNRLYIANMDPNFVIERVRIWNVLGTPVYEGSFKGSLDVTSLASGAYTVEFTDTMGRHARYKIIKE